MRCKDCKFYIKAIQEDRTDAMVCMFDYKKRWLIDGCENGQAKVELIGNSERLKKYYSLYNTRRVVSAK
jgi:hypothetical protein